jgi:hypothetical protein
MIFNVNMLFYDEKYVMPREFADGVYLVYSGHMQIECRYMFDCRYPSFAILTRPAACVEIVAVKTIEVETAQTIWA